MNKFGIGNVSYTPICSSEEMKLEIKIPSANEVVKNMWDKLDYIEKGFINIMIDINNKQEEEIENLNTTIESNINSYNKLAKYSAELEDRIDKAIEYIEKRRNSAYIIRLADGGIELINILKGSDKE